MRLHLNFTKNLTAIFCIADHVLADDIIEMTLRPDDLSPADFATNCFSFPSNSPNGSNESVSELMKRLVQMYNASNSYHLGM